MADKPSLLFINQHYYPDCAATAQMLTDLAEYLAAEEFDVHVVCSRGHYLSGSMDVPGEEVHNGVHIHRVPATAFGRESTLGRLVDYASFYMSTLVRVLTGRSYDYIVSLTTPPLLPFVGAVARGLRNQRYGIWSMDLHPDAEVASGMLSKNGIAASLLHAVNDVSYRRADFVVDLGKYMKERIVEKGVERRRTHTIPVWSREEDVDPVPHDENPVRTELGLENKFVVMYSGNAGIAHRFDEVLEVMKRLESHPRIRFVFVGEGPKKEAIESFADEHSLSNFQYLPYFPREQLKYSLSIADVHLLTLRHEMAGIAVPGKLYGIMAAGRPVIMVGPADSESAETIRTHGAGEVIDPREHTDGVEALYHSLLQLYSDEERRERFGANGRKAFDLEYKGEVTCERWTALFRSYLQQEEKHAMNLIETRTAA